MAFSRRPARFKRPDFMKTKAISQEKLELLRAAAARVYINEPNPADKSTEVNKHAAAGYANVMEEAGVKDGVELLAIAAIEIEKQGKKMRN